MAGPPGSLGGPPRGPPGSEPTPSGVPQQAPDASQEAFVTGKNASFLKCQKKLFHNTC